MSKSVDNLKLAIFSESCSDGSFGSDTAYYLRCSTQYEDLRSTADIVFEHYCMVYELDKNMHSPYADEADEEDKESDPYWHMKALFDNQSPDAEYFRHFSFDDGYFSADCTYAEGKEIAPVAASFFRANFDYTAKENLTASKAENSPEDYKALQALLALIKRKIAHRHSEYEL